MMLNISLLLLVILSTVRAIPVDNGVEGDPEIECGPTSITVNFNTRNEFEGQVYVKGLFAEGACKNEEGGRQVAGIELPFDSCNTRRARSLNPKGVFVSTVVIISFHPLFVTKVDRAFRIQCFYMEADKTVDTNLEVSMLTTDFRTQFVPMPICRYEIFETTSGGGRNNLGNIVEYALVGDPVYHKWTCDTETVDTFCMIVHSCYVDDTQGDKVDLINEDGCALDRYLLNNPEYFVDDRNLMAGVEAHVFKYADRVALYFQCQITILVQEPNQECPQPSCPEPAGRGAGGANPPLGPQPPAPQHPFPLVNGPYVDTAPVYGEPRVPSRASFRLSDNNQRQRQRQPRGPRGRPSSQRFRGKRSVVDSGMGTMDVQATIDTLDFTPKGLDSPSVPRRVIHVQREEDPNDYCVSPVTFTVSAVLGVIVMVALGAAVLFVSKRK